MDKGWEDSLMQEVSEWVSSMGAVFDTVAHLYAEVPLTREEFMETAERLGTATVAAVLSHPELRTDRRMEYMFDRAEETLFNRHPLPNRWIVPLQPETVH